MHLLTAIPDDADNGSQWQVFRESGAMHFATLNDGILYEGESPNELDRFTHKYGREDPVIYYAKLTKRKETVETPDSIKMGVSIDSEALDTIITHLDAINEMMRHMPEHKHLEYRRRDADIVRKRIELIKSEILE